MTGGRGTRRQQILEAAAGGIREAFDPELLRAFDTADQSVPADLVDPDRVRLNADRLRLSGDGIFFTLQGEGQTMGMPAVFLRLHVCNLRCHWCDAPYTWDPRSEGFWTESDEADVATVAAAIRRCWQANTESRDRRLVITGGEPLLQRHLLDDLLRALDGWEIEIETNGTIMPTELQLQRCQFNCSPKLTSSGNTGPRRISPKVLAAISGARSQFKFVMMGEADIEEMERDFLPLIDPAKIVLMPQGVTAAEVQQNARRVVDMAGRKGYRLLGRLHVSVWGAKRRV